MRAGLGLLAACLPLALLAACDGPPPGKAEMAAKVYDERITVPELEAELKAAEVQNTDDPRVRVDALQRIILRKLMAREAHKQKLDHDPSYLPLKRAAVESLDASLVQRATLQKVATPTLPEATAYVAAHPEMFAQRTVYLMDELLVARAPDASLVEALKPLDDLGAIEKLLQDRRVPYRRGVDQIDTLRVEPSLSLQIARQPTSAILLPAPQGFVIARARASKVDPVTGEAATTVATAMLTAQRKQKAVNDVIQRVLADAKTHITYTEGYAPPELTSAKK